MSLGKQLCQSCPAKLFIQITTQYFLNKSEFTPVTLSLTGLIPDILPDHHTAPTPFTVLISTTAQTFVVLQLYTGNWAFCEEYRTFLDSPWRCTPCRWMQVACSLLARTEYDTNTIVRVWSTALIQKNQMFPSLPKLGKATKVGLSQKIS